MILFMYTVCRLKKFSLFAIRDKSAINIIAAIIIFKAPRNNAVARPDPSGYRQSAPGLLLLVWFGRSRFAGLARLTCEGVQPAV
jgi:hypothetical protein